MGFIEAFIIAFSVEAASSLSCSPHSCEEAHCSKIMLGDSDWINRVKTDKQRFVCDGSDGGGWTVIQQRLDGRQRFDYGWSSYRKGFGRIHRTREFWLGLAKIHELTCDEKMVLRVDLSIGNKSMFIEYGHFLVGDDSALYMLNIGAVTSMSRQASDSLFISNGSFFATKDNDPYKKKCASSRYATSGGWWWPKDSLTRDDCNSSNLNGLYTNQASGFSGVVWSSFTGSNSLTATKMRIRRGGFSRERDCEEACYSGEACILDSIIDKSYSCVSTKFRGFPDEAKTGAESRTLFYIVSGVILGGLTTILVATLVDIRRINFKLSRDIRSLEKSMARSRSLEKQRVKRKSEGGIDSEVTELASRTFDQVTSQITHISGAISSWAWSKRGDISTEHPSQPTVAEQKQPNLAERKSKEQIPTEKTVE